jgi:hypothetical protein
MYRIAVGAQETRMKAVQYSGWQRCFQSGEVGGRKVRLLQAEPHKPGARLNSDGFGAHSLRYQHLESAGRLHVAKELLSQEEILINGTLRT